MLTLPIRKTNRSIRKESGLRTTLRTIVNIAPKGSTFIFDYYNTDAFDPEKVAFRVEGWKCYARQAAPVILIQLIFMGTLSI